MQSHFGRARKRISGRAGGKACLTALGLALLFALTVPGDAQTSLQQQALSQLQQFMQDQAQQRSNNTSNGAQQQAAPTTTQPATTTVSPASTNQTQQIELIPPSRLEQIMSQRAGVKLRLFGYDQLGQGRDVMIPEAGAVQDDYVLGPGDSIIVTLRGQENSQSSVSVDRAGQLTLPRMRPIAAGGRTFGSIRQEIEAAVARGYVATNAFVTLGLVRQVSVLVSGEVNNPGQRTLNGLSSAVDAIQLSGGVKKSGSLRNVRIQRGGREFTVDLYSVLTSGGGATNLRLADGDRILVPLLGPTVAVSGLVRRPAIYELPSRQSGIAVRSLLDLAGGQEVRGRYRFSVLRILPDGSTQMTPLTGDAGTVNDSEILFAEFGASQVTGQATLSGGTALAGPIAADTRLSDILRAPGALGPAPYTLFGLILRKDSQTLLRTLVPFTPVAVLRGTEDETLHADDVVRVFQVNEIQILSQTIKVYKTRRQTEQETIRNPLATTDSSDGNTQNETSQASAAIVGAQNAQTSELAAQRDVLDILNMPGLPTTSEPAANFEEQPVGTGRFATNREITSFSDLAHQLQLDAVVLVNFLIDHQSTIDGAVGGPGDYLVGPNVPLQDLVQAAGGTANWADQSGVELISTSIDSQTGRAETKRVNLPLRQSMLADYIVKPRDSLRFNQVFTDVNVGTVTLQGEVRFPGTYAIVRGEHLSDLLVRAGGLTSTAYPYGTVFLRKSAAAVEHDGNVRMAQELENQFLLNNSRLGSVPVPASQIQALATQLRTQKSLGRIAIVADPSILASRPEIDPLLEGGDVLYIPQRPSTIAVLGQVMQQGSYRYERGQTVKDYIEKAGGYAQASDESNTFLVLPDGSARRIDVSWLSFDNTALPPGSAIVVPRDLMPFDLRQALVDSTQILGQLSQFAVTAASLAILAKQ